MDTIEEGRRVRTEKLRWHCRRALLELDLVFERFWRTQGDVLDAQDEAALERLLSLEDHDLWELVSGRRASDDPKLTDMLERLRGA